MERKSGFIWASQSVSGIILVLLLGLHWVAQHYLASEGLRSYSEVVRYLSNPLISAMEVAFLVFVTAHSLLGLRAILLDLGPKPALLRVIDGCLSLIGLLTVAYGVQLTWQIIH